MGARIAFSVVSMFRNIAWYGLLVAMVLALARGERPATPPVGLR
jgi:hypothetical protein